MRKCEHIYCENEFEEKIVAGNVKRFCSENCKDKNYKRLRYKNDKEFREKILQKGNRK